MCEKGIFMQISEEKGVFFYLTISGAHPKVVTIIHLSPGSTQPAVHTIHSWLGVPC